MKSRYWFCAIVVLTILLIMPQSLFPQTEFTHRDHIKFTSHPPLTAQAGVEYTYTAKAVSNDTTAKIYYYLVPSPISSVRPPSIDSLTGVLTFSPAAKGWYAIEIMARSTNGGSAKQLFILTIRGGNGIVQGRVTDTSGVGINNIIIEVLQALNTSTTSIGCYAYYNKTDKNGYYRMSNIDPGNYKLRAVSPTPRYTCQWYDGKYSPDEANIISISDSASASPTIANFTLRGGAEILPMVKVSGIVTDTNLLPIKPTTNIFFVRHGFALNSKDITDDYREYFNLSPWWGDFRLDGRSQHVYHAKGDSLGRYSISLPMGTYIAFAKAPGYAKEFYLDKSDLLSANLIVLKQDSAGINFTLAPLPPVALGTIKGSVLDSLLDKGVPSRIIAYRDRWLSKDKFNSFRSYVVDTDSLGVYMIDSLLPGSYYVLAVPLGNYAPAFYSNDTISTRWKKASRVVVDGNTVSDINIYVHQIPSITNGYSSISGKIRSASISASMAGALVYAYRNGAISGYAVTNDDGKYSIEGLAPGTYTVMADKLGCSETTPISATVSYSINGNPVGASIDFSIDETTDVTQTSIQRPIQFMLEQNYPNPFNPSTTINYTLNQSGVVTLKVYNLIGQEVYTLVDGFQNAGSYRATFDAQGLSSGIYFYRLKGQSTIQTRKMILLR
jgi:protocatechuate 3,4-dioxygenase beta subunit